ncbi:MAG TPA: ATP phosphoribosyltransferase regulatory subunit [Solirubrobacter sp.]|nr:ATP phosphoribosyltransferase regulatory subunit [Solirubrobacter sp.]
MIHPIPSGTRDVLPDELRELRAITDGMRAVFDARSYGEVATPALEYEDVLTRGDQAAADPAYRLFDEHGNVLVLRSDMTIPIARVVATRYPSAPVPLRFYYLQHAYRAVHQHRAQPREILQVGIELVGAPGPEGTAEAVTVLCAALDAAGLRSYRVGLGDASLFSRALERAGVEDGARDTILHELATRDLVGLERELARAGSPDGLLELATTRGGIDTLDGVPEAEPLRALYDGLPEDVRARVIFDLGLVRTLGYYTGAVFEVYDAAFGAPIGGGGRYDDLLGRFGRELPACGWALDVERVHAARLEEGVV